MYYISDWRSYDNLNKAPNQISQSQTNPAMNVQTKMLMNEHTQFKQDTNKQVNAQNKTIQRGQIMTTLTTNGDNKSTIRHRYIGMNN